MSNTKRIQDLTLEEAIKIANYLNQEKVLNLIETYPSPLYHGGIRIVFDELKEDDGTGTQSKQLEIHENGMIVYEFVIDYDEYGENQLLEVNTLPIFEYLYSRGYCFYGEHIE